MTNIPATMDLLHQFPSQVFIEICEYLPPEYISEWLLALPKDNVLRQAVVEAYYSQEIHFIISPPPRPHFCPRLERMKALLDFEYFGQIDDFIGENSDITPQVLKLIVGNDFSTFKELIEGNQEYFQSIPCIELQIGNYELSAADLTYIVSKLRSNLLKLQIGGTKLKKCFPALQSCLGDLEKLRNLIILGHSVLDWSGVQLPSTLRLVDISWNNNCNMQTLKVPDSVEELFWNQSGLKDLIIKEISFPPLLKTLMLTYNNISSIDVGTLPASLEVLDLTYNMVGDFKNSGRRGWPANLHTLLLSHNAISDETLVQLKEIGWPEFLKILRLENNPFSSLANLSSLPENLELFSLNDSLVRSLEVSAYDLRLDTYPFFRFPMFLERLELCDNLHWRYDAYVDSSKKIQFPSTLRTLDLTECSIKTLKVFAFPSSLVELILNGNLIEDLSSYDDGHVNWQALTKLTTLEVYANRIKSLSHWKLPKNLRMLNLGMNEITRIERMNTPLFGDYDCKLQQLRLDNNVVDYVDHHIRLPASLKHFSLANNYLTEFPVALTRWSLEELNLTGNQLERLIQFSSKESTMLKRLDLTDNEFPTRFRLGREKAEARLEFYESLEKILGIQLRQRNANVNSIHRLQ